jgi:hypothetical protein
MTMRRHTGNSGEHLLRVFRTRREAEAALGALLDGGFKSSHLSLILQSPVVNQEHGAAAAIEDAVGTSGNIGAGIGGVVGGFGGILAGLGLVAVPGLGPILAIGPIAAALTGALMGSAVGGVAGALIGLGVSEVEAAECERHLRQGQVVLVVHCGYDCAPALRIIRAAGEFHRDTKR